MCTCEKHYTEGFDITSGVKQGDVLSPTLFSMFYDDLATSIKNLGYRVNLENSEMYTDDIVLIALDESTLQAMVNFVSSWCLKWRMVVNTEKMQIVHFCPPTVSPQHQTPQE